MITLIAQSLKFIYYSKKIINNSESLFEQLGFSGWNKKEI